MATYIELFFSYNRMYRGCGYLQLFTICPALLQDIVAIQKNPVCCDKAPGSVWRKNYLSPPRGGHSLYSEYLLGKSVYMETESMCVAYF